MILSSNQCYAVVVQPNVRINPEIAHVRRISRRILQSKSDKSSLAGIEIIACKAQLLSAISEIGRLADGRATRKSGQVWKEAALVGSGAGRLAGLPLVQENGDQISK